MRLSQRVQRIKPSPTIAAAAKARALKAQGVDIVDLTVGEPDLDTPEFKFFVVSLSIQRETGGNLAETLANLSDILRRRRQMRLKIKAMSSEARASAMILGSLPFLMFGVIYLLNPDYESTLFVDPRGRMMLAAGLAMMALGIAVMRKMVRFEV